MSLPVSSNRIYLYTVQARQYKLDIGTSLFLNLCHPPLVMTPPPMSRILHPEPDVRYCYYRTELVLVPIFRISFAVQKTMSLPIHAANGHRVTFLLNSQSP